MPDTSAIPGTVTPVVTVEGLPNFAGLAAHIESETARLHESVKAAPPIDPAQIAADITALVNAVQTFLAIFAQISALFGGKAKPG